MKNQKTLTNYPNSNQLVAILSTDIFRRIADKEISKEALFEQAESNSALLPTLIEGTASPKASIRYGCASTLMHLSEKHPNKLYPYMNNFISLLDSEYRILTWNALAIIANLTRVDVEKKFDAVFDKYYSNLQNEYMVTVANTVGNSATIAKAKPYLAQKITDELLKVENIQLTPHLTSECKLVIAEKAIETFDAYFDSIEDKEKVLDFVKKHLNSSRVSLGEQANEFMKKWA